MRSRAKVKEAEQYAEEDKKRKEEVEIRNRAESLIYETEKIRKRPGRQAVRTGKD